jgi:hypothetical protein
MLQFLSVRQQKLLATRWMLMGSSLNLKLGLLALEQLNSRTHTSNLVTRTHRPRSRTRRAGRAITRFQRGWRPSVHPRRRSLTLSSPMSAPCADTGGGGARAACSSGGDGDDCVDAAAEVHGYAAAGVTGNGE